MDSPGSDRRISGIASLTYRLYAEGDRLGMLFFYDAEPIFFSIMLTQNVNYRLVESYACENATRSSEITPRVLFFSFRYAIYSTKGSFILIDKNGEEFVRAKIPNSDKKMNP